MRIKSYSYKSSSSDRCGNRLSTFHYLAAKLLRPQMTFTRRFVYENVTEDSKTHRHIFLTTYSIYIV